MKLKNIYFFIFLNLLIILNYDNSFAKNNIKIVKKINGEIITNFDIKRELDYLSALNNSLKNLDPQDAYKIAEESLVREKIKHSEIKKFTSLENLNNPNLIDKIISNLITDLNLTNKSEFIRYLKKFELEIADVEKKISIEVLWNQLIGSKFRDKIIVDENELLRKIKKENLNEKNIIEYDLSEIIFQAKDQEELKNIIQEINISINQIGFDNTANKFSISNSAKFGGKIGKVKQNQLSEIILKELNKINVGEFTRPMKIGSGFMIILINDKQIINEKIDENIMLKNMIEFEKQKQYENYSQIYFNKIKINSQINEF